MNIFVQMDIKAVTRHVSRVHKPQIPFATAQALSDSAVSAGRPPVEDQIMFGSCARCKIGVIRERAASLCVQFSKSLNTNCLMTCGGNVQSGAASATRQMLPLHNGGAFSNAQSITS